MSGKNNIDDACYEASASISDVQKRCCSFENLYKAMNICKRNVLWKDSVAGFVKNGLKNCNQLHKRVDSWFYEKVGLYD